MTPEASPHSAQQQHYLLEPRGQHLALYSPGSTFVRHFQAPKTHQPVAFHYFTQFLQVYNATAPCIALRPPPSSNSSPNMNYPDAAKQTTNNPSQNRSSFSFVNILRSTDFSSRTVCLYYTENIGRQNYTLSAGISIVRHQSTSCVPQWLTYRIKRSVSTLYKVFTVGVSSKVPTEVKTRLTFASAIPPIRSRVCVHKSSRTDQLTCTNSVNKTLGSNLAQSPHPSDSSPTPHLEFSYQHSLI